MTDRTLQPGDVSYLIYTGNCAESRATTMSEARRAARKHSKQRKMPARIARDVVAPDGLSIVQAPSLGGTWNGRCGSTFWVEDPHLTLIVEQPDGLIEGHSKVRTTQVWHRKAVRGEEVHASLGGFRVICEGDKNHTHGYKATPCSIVLSLGKIEWNWKDTVVQTIQAAWEQEGCR